MVTSEGVDTRPFSPFTVTFSYGGNKWPGNSPAVSFRVNPNTTDCSAEEVAVQNAVATWMAVSKQKLSITYAGATETNAAGVNGANEIVWRDLGNTGPVAHAIT